MLLIVFLQNLVGRYIPYEAPESIEKINQAKKDHANIIYFGDSTTTWSSKYDSDIRSTPLFLSDFTKDKYTVVGISHPSYGALLFDKFTQYMTDEHYYPEFIIIPINLRSFSPDWDLRPEHQFINERLYISLHNTMLAPFLSFLLNIGLTDVNRIYDNLYNLAPIYDRDTIVGINKEFHDKLRDSTLPNVQNAIMFQMFYLGRIHENHRNIQSLVHIADRYQYTKTKVIFYITPIDYETGEKYFGKRFYNQMKENVTTITSELTKHNAIVLDLSATQPSKNFTWNETTYVNEHLNQSGRSSIVKALLPIIDQRLVEKK